MFNIHDDFLKGSGGGRGIVDRIGLDWIGLDWIGLDCDSGAPVEEMSNFQCQSNLGFVIFYPRVDLTASSNRSLLILPGTQSQ